MHSYFIFYINNIECGTTNYNVIEICIECMRSRIPNTSKETQKAQQWTCFYCDHKNSFEHSTCTHCSEKFTYYCQKCQCSSKTYGCKKCGSIKYIKSLEHKTSQKL